MKRPICITGSGIVSAIGLNKAETLDSLRNARTGIGKLHFLQTVHDDLPTGEVKHSNEDLKRMLGISPNRLLSRTSMLGILAVREALEEAGITPSHEQRIGFISGTTVGGMDLTEKHFLDIVEGDSYNEIIGQHNCGACTETIADYFGGFTFVTSVSTACSSAANAILLGSELIEQGDLDIVVVGGSESLTKYHLNGFNALMILDKEQCRPFDDTRCGLNLGEGAAYLVLENSSSVQRRGKSIKGILSGYGNACDAFHQTASSPDGEGAFLAMKEALLSSGLKPSDIGYINAHGTGTINNDESESHAIKRLFGEKIPPVSSTKSFTGHTTSASGSIEAVICLLALQYQFLPINLNWKVPMNDGIIPNMEESPARKLNHVLCNAFGFGGNDTSLLFTNSEEK